MSTKKIAICGMLTALAIVLSYVETLIPVFFAIPGIKLGLTNIVVLFALYRLDIRSAAVISLIRIFLAGLLFGSGVSILYSLSGGILSLLVMILLKKTGLFKMLTVSVAGGVTHNAGQLLVAVFLLRTTAVAWYFAVLWFTGIAAGVLIGILGTEISNRIKLDL